MSTIDKMLIKGIRSFDPENKAVITFFKPLTLIVGPNGSGKTTIIECLKNATTGEMPPNARSGHSFIHDPKVAGEVETKGQIKLRFKTGAGKDVVCIRSFQLTQKEKNMQFKAIESVLQTINALTGEKVSLSYRCADMDREVPALMGVSKAILENVIFVHQDESNWPLGDPATLKKKFDDIFSATRYTKALETLKKLQKDQAQTIKEFKLKLDHLQTLRDAVIKLRESVKSDSDRAAALQEQIRGLDVQIQGTQTRIEEMEGNLKEAGRLKEEIRVKDAKRQVLLQQKAQIMEDLGEEVAEEDTDEELQEWSDQFEVKLTEVRYKVKQAERQLIDHKQLQATEQGKHVKESKAQGRLQAEAEQHEKDKLERDASLEALFARHKLGEVGPRPLSQEGAARLAQRAAQRLAEMQTNCSKLKDLNKLQDHKLSNDLEKVRASLNDVSNKASMKQQQQSEASRRLREVERELGTINISEEELRNLDEKEKSTKEAADALALKAKSRDFEGQIERARTELFQLESKIRVLQREKDGLAAEGAERVQLRVKKEDLSAKEAALKKLLEDHASTFQRVFKGQTPANRELQSSLASLVKASKAQRDEASQRSLEAGKRAAGLEERLRNERERLTRYKRELKEKMDGVLDGMHAALSQPVDVDAYDAKVLEVSKDRDKKKTVLDQVDAFRRFYEAFLENAETNACCPMCDRPFNGNELGQFVTKTRSKRAEADTSLRTIQKQLRTTEAQYKAVRELQPLYSDYKSLKEGAIPDAEGALRQLEGEAHKANEAHEEAVLILAQEIAEVEGLDRLRPVAEGVERLAGECEALRGAVAAQEYKLDALSQNLRSMADVNAEIAELEDKRQSTSRALDQLREEQVNLSNDWQGANMRWRNAREEKMEAAARVQRVARLREEAARITENNRRLDVEIQSLKQSVEPLTGEQQQLNADREAHRRRAHEEEEAAQGQLRSLQRDSDNLHSLTNKIEQYLQSGREEQLAQVAARLAQSLARQEQLEADIVRLTEEAAQLNKSLDEQQQIKRQVEQNIVLRNVSKTEAQVSGEIEALERQVALIGDLRSLDAQMKKLLMETQAWLAEQNRYRGAISTYESNISRNRASMREAQYKDVEKRYSAQLIQLKTSEMANRDLSKYYTALDKALMRFHAMKMEEINKIIKELWQQTYRGQDIDYIEIRSDAEGATGTRSYSYRVVMRSGDAELDMRGRCSAGQKVLASLIIRLALAETFCLNCGILALDEPTTNLDAPNAESLANALLRIMEERRGQENFQLVVITHDEKFAQLIGQKEHAEHYYRISKDDHQHSHIELQDIFD